MCMSRIPNVTRKLWEENVVEDKKPRYSVHVVDCKYASVLGAYNRYCFSDLVVLHTSLIETDADYTEEVQETNIYGISSVFDENIFISRYIAFQTDNVATSGYYIVQLKSMPYILSEPHVCY